MPRFKVGDVVQCVDSSSFQRRLTEGKTYVVRECSNMFAVIVNDD
jgi:hypothetical protein